MQLLGLSDSTPKTEGRLKSLFWPTIRNDVDLDVVTTQGFWLCAVVAAFTLVVAVLSRGALPKTVGFFEAAFYFLAGMGVRMRSRMAAGAAFAAYLLGGVVLQKYTGQGFGIPRLIFLALLLANVRGIWLSATWTAAGPEEVPVRLSETWRDKLSDQLPALVWPKARFLFYVVALVELAVLLLELFPLVPATSGAVA
jgi:hypothetical protein